MTNQQTSWRRKNRIYIIPIVLAMIMFMLIAPERMEGDAMDPTISDGDVVVLKKDTFSAKRGSPKLGAVVVLEKNIAKKVQKDNIIARIVGLPNDVIEIKQGKFYRNSKEYNVSSAKGNLGEDLKVTLGKEQVFVLCDNRNEKIDSRAKALGVVNMQDIRGTAKFVVWPFSDFGGIN